jgi:SAM-dependent methyltransferase
MKRDLTTVLCCPDCSSDLVLVDETPTHPEVERGSLGCRTCGVLYPIVRGVPRFVASDAYVGSFSYEWNRWNTVQLDSANGGHESEDTFREKTGFTSAELKGKLVLDVGCGAGRFLDVVSQWGGTAIGVDLSFAVDAAHRTLGARPGVSVVQADVNRLPFRPQTFDAIFSLGVLHHSRDTREAFLHLPPLLKDDGEIAVWLYYYTDQLYNLASDAWRLLLRPLPTWAVYAWSWLLVTLFSDLWLKPVMSRRPWLHLRRLLPVNTHTDRQWRVLDTFDWYSPRYQDKACSPARVVSWCREGGVRDVRVLTFPTSIRGRRDPKGRFPLVRWDVPDVRECRVLLFGAGAAGEQMLHFLEMVAPGRVVGVVDNDPAKAGLTLGRFQVQGFAAVPRDAYDVVVIASLPGLQPISAQLAAAGLTPNQDFVAADRVQQWYDLVRQYEAQAA